MSKGIARHKWMIYSLLLFMSGVSTTHAAEEHPFLALARAAIERSKLRQSIQFEMQASEEAHQQANRLFDSKATMRVESGVEGDALFQNPPVLRNDLALAFTKPLYNRTLSAAAERNLRVRHLDEARVLEAENAILVRYAQTYVDLLEQQELRKVQEQQVRILIELRDASERSMMLGRSTKVELQLAMSRVSQGEEVLQEIEQRLRILKTRLSQLTGQPISLPLAPVSLGTDLNPKALASSADQKPEISVQRRRIALAQADISTSRAKESPRINLTAELEHRQRNQTPSTTYAVVVSLEYDFNIGKALTHEIQSAVLRKTAAEELLRDIQWETSSEIATSLVRLDFAHKDLALATKTHGLLGDVLTSIRKQVTAGTERLPELLEAQEDVFAAERRIVEAQFGVVDAQLELLSAAGKMTLKGLEEAL